MWSVAGDKANRRWFHQKIWISTVIAGIFSTDSDKGEVFSGGSWSWSSLRNNGSNFEALIWLEVRLVGRKKFNKSGGVLLLLLRWGTFRAILATSRTSGTGSELGVGGHFGWWGNTLESGRKICKTAK